MSILEKLFLRLKYRKAIKQKKEIFSLFKNHTMISENSFMANLELFESFSAIEGNIVECGTWKGGMIAGAAKLLGDNRQYYLFDSFEGLPDAKEIDGQAAIEWQKDTTSPDYHNNCRASIHDAEEAMKLADITNYQIIKGWFEESLPNSKNLFPIAILRLDADWYSSTMTCLDNLYPMVNKGGIIILDDYYTWDGCSKALHDYLSRNELADRLHSHKGVAYIKKNDRI